MRCDEYGLQQKIEAMLTVMGTKYLKKEYKDKWSENNPTRGYCYVVSEVLHHYYYTNTDPYIIKVGDETHWFLKTHEGRVIDFTASQYMFKLDYSEGKKAYFLTKQPSKRGQILADLLSKGEIL